MYINAHIQNAAREGARAAACAPAQNPGYGRRSIIDAARSRMPRRWWTRR